MRRYEIRDDNWQRLFPLLLSKSSNVGRTSKYNLLFIITLLRIGRSGALGSGCAGSSSSKQGYNSSSLSKVIAKREAAVVIPSRANAKGARLIDENLSKDKNKIACYINRIKHYRRVATR